jgi:nitrite reductase (NADH) small subunit
MSTTVKRGGGANNPHANTIRTLQNVLKNGYAIDLGGSLVLTSLKPIFCRNGHGSSGGRSSFHQGSIKIRVAVISHEVCEGTKMPEYLTVARVSALLPGMGTVVTVKGQELAVFNVEGKFHAMDNRCPHQDYPLGMSPIFDNLVICIGHAWRFDIKSGECHSVPGVRVRTYEVIIEGDEVKIQDDAIPNRNTTRL